MLDRRNNTDTRTTNFTVGATGDLFEGGSWTWDARQNFGESERDRVIKDLSSARRIEMAAHSLWDPTANGGQGAAVCAIDSNAPYEEPVGPGPDYVADAGLVEGESTIREGGETPCAAFNPCGLAASP